MAHEDGGARVLVVGVKLLDSHHRRLVFLDEGFELGLQLNQPIRQRRLGLQPDHAAVDQDRADGTVVDYPVAGDSQAGIDAEDSHEFVSLYHGAEGGARMGEEAPPFRRRRNGE